MGAVLEKRLSAVGVEAWREPGFAVFASSPGVGTPTKASFKLAVIYNQLLKPQKSKNWLSRHWILPAYTLAQAVPR